MPIKHDEQRFEAFSTLAHSSDDSDFLSRLKAAYAGLGIGAGLDFAGIEQGWLHGHEFTREWRVALAKQTPFDLYPYSAPGTGEVVERLYQALFQGDSSAQWVARTERLLLLTAPLLPAHALNLLMRFADDWRVADHRTAFDGTLGVGLRQWAQHIADGEGQWAPLAQWLRDGGTDPSLLLRELDAELGPIPLETVMAFGGVRQLLLTVREQLLLGSTSADTWIDLLWVHLRHLDDSASLRRLPVPLSVAHHCALPLLKVLKASPRYRHLMRGSDQSYALSVLFGDVGMAALFTESPAQFNELLAGVSDEMLRDLRVSRSFAQLYPDYALLFEQQRWRRAGSIAAQVRSPEARDWYLSVVSQTHAWEFVSLLEQLQLNCDAEQFHDVILAHIYPREDEDCPDTLLENSTVEHLYHYLSAANGRLRERAAHRLFELASVRQVAEDEDDEQPGAYAQHPQNWAMLIKASAAYPSLFIHTLKPYELHRDDLARWELVWNGVAEHEQAWVASALFASCGDTHHGEQVLDLIERLYEPNAEPWLSAISNAYSYHLHGPIEAIANRDTPLLRLLPLMAARDLSESANWLGSANSERKRHARAGVRRALQTYPQEYAALEEKARIKLLQLFDDATVLACAEALSMLLASSSKLLREPAVALVGRCTAHTIEASGLLDAAPKVRRLVLIGLGLAPQPAMLDLLSRYFKDSAHDEYSRGLSLDALERGGHSVAGLDPWADATLPALQAQAVGLKIPAAVSKCWNDEFAHVLAPLGDALGLQLLHILFEGSEQLPRRARQLLQHLPAGRRSDLAWLAARQWIAANGAVELDWMLLTLPVYGDERIANDLAKAVKDWKKVRKQKASAAMRLLCQLPGNYGVSLARDLWESGKFSESIESAAQQALTEAGEREGMSLEEFLEQLVPDFGMTHQGLILDVGPYCYTVRMRPDLSLVVLSEEGKASKSLPTAKAGEDLDKRSVAQNQYKALAKNLKPVFKQQSKRMSRLFQLGNAWPAAMWQKLFVAHPLMAVIAQSVVWSAEDAQGQALKRFRPAEGGELIDLDDEPYQLPAGALVHATHPLELDPAEREAWLQHFADYALESPIEQWTTPVLAPSAELLAADRLPLLQGKALNRGKFGSLLDKWGYIKGQAGDGARITEHTWLIDGGRWLVTLNHGDIDVYFEPDATVTLNNIEVHRRGEEGFERQRLGELPPAFLNTLLNQAQTLGEHAL